MVTFIFCLCSTWGAQVLCSGCGGQGQLLGVVLFTMWVLRIEFRPQALQQALLRTEPSHWPPFSVDFYAELQIGILLQFSTIYYILLYTKCRNPIFQVNYSYIVTLSLYSLQPLLFSSPLAPSQICDLFSLLLLHTYILICVCINAQTYKQNVLNLFSVIPTNMVSGLTALFWMTNWGSSLGKLNSTSLSYP